MPGLPFSRVALPARLPARWLAFGLAALATVSMPSQAARPVATVLAQAAAGSGPQQLEGVVQPIRQATVSAQVGGAVLVLAVKAGDRVRAGQTIARIDDRDAQAQVQQGEAGVAQAEAVLRQARLQVERNQALKAQGFLSQAALDQADTALQAAQAGLRQAQAGRAQALLARGFSTVHAPFDGLVLATHLEAGDLASPGRPIATLHDPAALRAVVQVPASLAGAARQASAVQVLLADGRRLSPSSMQWLPAADPVSQTVEWRLNLPPPAAGDAAVLPGQAVRVQWQGLGVAPVAAAAGGLGSASNPAAAPAAAVANPAAEAARGLPVLPAAAVLRRGELTAVYVVQGPRFVLRAVRLGAARGDGAIAVLAGLRPGERVAADAVAAGLADAVPAP